MNHCVVCVYKCCALCTVSVRVCGCLTLLLTLKLTLTLTLTLTHSLTHSRTLAGSTKPALTLTQHIWSPDGYGSGADTTSIRSWLRSDIGVYCTSHQDPQLCTGC